MCGTLLLPPILDKCFSSHPAADTEDQSVLFAPRHNRSEMLLDPLVNFVYHSVKDCGVVSPSILLMHNISRSLVK